MPVTVNEFKQAFKVKATKNFERRKDKTQAAITELEKAVAGLVASDPALAAKFDAQLKQIRAAVANQEQAAANAPQQAYKAMDKLKGHARKVSTEALQQSADSLNQALVNEAPQEICKKLAPLHQAGSAELASQTSDDPGAQLRVFIAQATNVLTETRKLKTTWDALAPQFVKRKTDSQTLVARLKQYQQDKLTNELSLALSRCEAASGIAGKFKYAQAIRVGNEGLKMCDIAEQKAVTLFSATSLDQVLPPVAKALGALVAAAMPRSPPDWFKTTAQEIHQRFDQAVALDKAGKFKEALGEADAGTADLAALKTRWAQYIKPEDDWIAGKEVRATRLLRASLYKKQAKQRGLNDFVAAADQIEQKSREAQALADKIDFVAANAKSNEASDLSKDLKKKFGGLLKKELADEAGRLMQANPQGPEAQMTDALGAEEFFERLEDCRDTAMIFGFDLSMLSPGEMVAVFTYTANDYEPMNQFLWGKLKPQYQKMDPKALQTRADQAKAAMAKLPSYTDTTTKRGEREWDGADKQYQVGGTFTTQAFWSTSISKPFPGKYQIEIHCKTGKRVDAISAHPNEEEVLYPPGVKFRVKNRVDLAADKVLVELEEV